MLPRHPRTPLYPKSCSFQKEKNIRKQRDQDGPRCGRDCREKRKAGTQYLTLVYTARISEVDTKEEQEPLP